MPENKTTLIEDLYVILQTVLAHTHALKERVTGLEERLADLENQVYDLDVDLEHDKPRDYD
jgi:polyhydroxyalkanoate synthesis regulator phasin